MKTKIIPIGFMIAAVIFMLTIAGTTVNAATVSIDGANILEAAGWDNGLPASGNDGSIPNSVTADTSNTALFSGSTITLQSGGTFSSTADLSLQGCSFIMNGGALTITDDIFCNGSSSRITINDGVVSWGDRFEPNGAAPGGTITIKGGFMSHAAGGGTADLFGNSQAGTMNVWGGTVICPNFNFSAGSSYIGGDAVLSGANGTFGALDISSSWIGYFTITAFSGSDWETQFTSGNITLNGTALDAAGFAEHFYVSDSGKTLNPAAGVETSVIYSITDQIGTSGAITAGDPSWTGDIGDSWVVYDGGGYYFLRNQYNNLRAITRLSDTNFSYSIEDNDRFITVEFNARSEDGTGRHLAVGLSDGSSPLIAVIYGDDGYGIRHYDGSGSLTDTIGGAGGANAKRSFLLKINLDDNGGEGSAVLSIDGSPVQIVSNLHLKDAAAPAVAAVDSLYVQTDSKYIGPADITVSSVNPHAFIYDLTEQIGTNSTLITEDSAWAGDDLSDWVVMEYGGYEYLRNSDNGADTIIRLNDEEFSYGLEDDDGFVVVEFDARTSTGYSMVLGLSYGSDLLFGVDYAANAQYGIKHYDGSGSLTTVTSGNNVTTGNPQHFKLVIDCKYNNGNGSGVLYVDGVIKAASSNLYLKDSAAPALSDLNSLYLFSSAKYMGPSDITITRYPESASSTFIYNITNQIGSDGTVVTSDAAWSGDDLGDWIVKAMTGYDYIRNNDAGADTITRLNNPDFSYYITPSNWFVTLEFDARSADGNDMAVGLSKGDSPLFAVVHDTALGIRHYDGSGSMTNSFSSIAANSNLKRNFRLEVNLKTNNGDGVGWLYVDDVMVLAVTNMHLNDAAAPNVAELNSLYLHSASQYAGPGDITITLAPALTNITTYTYDITTEIGASGSSITNDPAWVGDISNWITFDFAPGQTYLRNVDNGHYTIIRPNNTNLAFSISASAPGLRVEFAGRGGGDFSFGLSHFDDLGFSVGIDAAGYAFIKHYDGSGSMVAAASSGTYSASNWRQYRLDINLGANSGDGSAKLYLDNKLVVSVSNMHLKDGAAPSITSWDSLHVYSNTRYSGPGSPTLSIFVPTEGGTIFRFM